MKSELYVRLYNRVRKKVNRSYRRLRRKGGWRAVGELFGIHYSMAYRIGVEGYMPSDRAICETLGLPYTVEVEVNPRTGRVKVPQELRPKKEPRHLDDMSVEELRWALENRVEVR